MPVRITKNRNGTYRVATPNGVHAKHTTKRKAQAQSRLIRAVDHGWKPTHEHHAKIMATLSSVAGEEGMLPPVRVYEFTHNLNMQGRSILETALNPAVQKALSEWVKAKGGGILIGGVARGLYGRPRMTLDADLIFASDADIPDYVDGFKRTRAHGFTCKSNGVEIEALSPEFLKWPTGLFDVVLRRATVNNGVLVADAAGLVATKLTRSSYVDLGDIEDILGANPNVDIQPFERFLTHEQRDSFEAIKKNLLTKGPRNSHDIPDEHY